jgi:KDO2-lipid IV(A) lauroyltransferase
MSRRKTRRASIDYLAYLAVRSVVAFAQMLTIEQSCALARGLAWLLYHIDARHRKVGLENLAHAYAGGLSDIERDQIIRGVYRHFCTMLMEILHIPRKIHLTNWRDWVVLQGHVKILDLFLDGDRPLILLTGH